MKSYVSESSIQTSAQSVMDKIGPSGGSVGYAVMRERHTTEVSFCHGLSIWFPLDSYRYLNNWAGGTYSPSYTSGNVFTTGTQWDEFLIWFFDDDNPSSSVDPLSLYTTSTSFTVSWDGWDIGPSTGSSSIKWYDVQYKDGGGSWTNWKAQTSSKSDTFFGVDGHTYYFRCRALDNAGNQESYSMANSLVVKELPLQG